MIDFKPIQEFVCNRCRSIYKVTFKDKTREELIEMMVRNDTFILDCKCGNPVHTFDIYAMRKDWDYGKGDPIEVDYEEK